MQTVFCIFVKVVKGHVHSTVGQKLINSGQQYLDVLKKVDFIFWALNATTINNFALFFSFQATVMRYKSNSVLK